MLRLLKSALRQAVKLQRGKNLCQFFDCTSNGKNNGHHLLRGKYFFKMKKILNCTVRCERPYSHIFLSFLLGFIEIQLLYMLCLFLQYDKVNQLHRYTYPLFFRSLSHLGNSVVKNHIPMQEMQEMCLRSLGHKDLLESDIIAWPIPWTEEPGKVQSMRSKRVRPS